MCGSAANTFTLTEWLHDPLVRIVMCSDGVSEKDFSELLRRVKATLSPSRGPGSGEDSEFIRHDEKAA